ncbi:MAG TPA: DUF5615 family PIN-like protein [Tepidisphaeraceae bacterium]|jgi:predicted nuclease of predicted toxin-antitoxin system|nr:DUF5615 family PIN-like protein [Tepidisphaeraceae bacterium]
MNLYIDEDSSHSLLVKFLRRAGHDVLVPTEGQSVGESDTIHLTKAIRQGRVLLTANHDDDFRELHELIKEAGGHHPGLFVIRQDNDAARDLTPRGVVVAIEKFSKSGVPVIDEFVILNHWR